MLDTPKEIDLLEWTQYAIFRSLLKQPFPSPRVWDNAGTLGFSGGNYEKDKFFDKDLFMNPFTKDISEKYGGLRAINADYGRIRKADQSLHSFCETKDLGRLYLNLENFIKAKHIQNEFSYENIYNGVRKIYSIVRFEYPAIDCGYVHTIQNPEINLNPNPNEYKWISFNKKLEIEINKKNNIDIEFIYESFSNSFGVPSEVLFEITKKLKYDLWLVNMFIYSFKSRNLQYINSSISEITNSKKSEEGDVEIIKNGEIEIVKSESQNTIENKKSLNNLYENNNPKNLRFIPSEAKIPIGFESFGDKVKDLEFALQNPSISFRSFLNDCEYIKDGNWIEETLFCKAFDEGLYCQLIREYHRYSIAELNSMKAEEMKKAERKGFGIGGLFGLLTGGIMAPITAAMGANVGKMISNNVDERIPLKDFLPDPFLVFLKDQGSYLTLAKTYKGANTKRRICLKQNSLNNENIYFDLIPMIVFDNWVTPAQIFKLENDYYFRPISANYDINNEFNLQYNPIKYRRSYSYDPRPQRDIEKLANIKVKTRIVGETIEKTPTIFHAWLRDDESFQHFYFDYATDGTIF